MDRLARFTERHGGRSLQTCIRAAAICGSYFSSDPKNAVFQRRCPTGPKVHKPEVLRLRLRKANLPELYEFGDGSLLAAGYCFAVRVVAGLGELAGKLLLQGGADEVFETLGGFVEMVERQMEVLAEIC